MEKPTGGTLTPAYGRDYTNRAGIVADLNARKDFMLATPLGRGYINLDGLGNGMFQVRDRSQRKLWTVTVRDGKAK